MSRRSAAGPADAVFPGRRERKEPGGGASRDDWEVFDERRWSFDDG
jgi:hypothetical protein